MEEWGSDLGFFKAFQVIPLCNRGWESQDWKAKANVCVCVCVYVLAQFCLTLSDPMNCSPPGSSVHGISQARILEWVSISSSWGSSQCRN